VFFILTGVVLPNVLGGWEDPEFTVILPLVEILRLMGTGIVPSLSADILISGV